MVAAGAGMGMDGGAVAGNVKVLLRYEAAFHGRQDGDMIEGLLEELLKVKRDILPGHEPFFNRFGDLGLCLLCFFPLGLSGFLLFQEAGSSFPRAYKSVLGAAQSRSMKSR